jgi:hypothetical protein
MQKYLLLSFQHQMPLAFNFPKFPKASMNLALQVILRAAPTFAATMA